MGISANKGEWSELYALLKILGDKKIHAGDAHLNKLESYYPVLKALRDEASRHMEYNIDSNIIVVSEDQSEICRISSADFLEQSKLLFSEIQAGAQGAGAFEIPKMDAFLNQIHCEKIKAKSRDKADIHLVVHDLKTGMQQLFGFSIKSEAGGKATLLNASDATGFIYKLSNINPSNAQAINNIDSSRKIQDRVIAINEREEDMKFLSIENTTFANNLRMIDSNLPEILAWMIKDCYINRDMNIRRAIDRITIANPFKYDLSLNHDFYGYKIKCFLVAIALGMLPATTWDGRYEATGGYIIVKEDGDLVCFHIYDRNLLEDYLLTNTKFETPSDKKFNLGRVYEQDNYWLFNLVLQIRFC